jgi:cytochrome b6-f complex iron-sulfur subunit
MSCQDCLNRREFLAKSAAAAAALVVVEGCGDGQIGPTGTTLGGQGVTINLADYPGLATVGIVVSIPADRALVRTSATTFQGYSRICTHEGCVTDIRANRFECPCHGSIFSSTGTVVRGPNGQSGGIAPLPALAAQFNQTAGTVTVA